MPKGSESTVALLVDDEPEYIGWIAEHLEAKGLLAKYAHNLPEALAVLASSEFRLIIVDMNIPANEALTPEMIARMPLAEKYPGLAVAMHCRNIGYGAHSVIAYTVHDDDLVDEEMKRINCRYVLKGRPQALKQVIEKSLESRPPIQRPPKVWAAT